VHIVVIGGNTIFFFASFYSLSALGLLHFFAKKKDDAQTHFGPLFGGFGVVVASQAQNVHDRTQIVYSQHHGHVQTHLGQAKARQREKK